jgi:ribosomal protein L11 methyltransferase
VVASLIEMGAEGVQEDGDALITYLAETPEPARIAMLIQFVDPDARVEIGAAQRVEYDQSWRARVSAHRVGDLVVAPPWLAADQGDPTRVITIEPATAFGTGEHETTRGVLRLMQHVMRRGATVADLGAGSAVLSIAAAKLGAAAVFAIEMDPEAIGNAEENVARNGVGDRVRVLEGDAATLLPVVAPVQLLLANILASVIAPLLPAMRRALTGDGTAIISGMLVTERDEMRELLARDEWEIIDEDVEGEWWSATIARR